MKNKIEKEEDGAGDKKKTISKKYRAQIENEQAYGKCQVATTQITLWNRL